MKKSMFNMQNKNYKRYYNIICFYTAAIESMFIVL